MQAQPIVQRLQDDLLTARKAQDGLTVSALQSVLARITNAEAVPVDAAQKAYVMRAGVGSTEVPRRTLSEQDVRRIIQDEIDELQNAIAGMAEHAGHPYAAELHQKAAILTKYLGQHNTNP